MDTAVFAHRLTQLRQARGLNQAALAQLAGLTPQAISLLEKGKRRPLMDTCERLAAALNVDLDELLSPPAQAA